MTMAEVAKACGLRGQSSYQRYEDSNMYKRQYIPLELAEKLARAFSGRGSPPIQENEVLALAGLKRASNDEWEELGRQLRMLPAKDRADIVSSIEAMLRLVKKHR